MTSKGNASIQNQLIKQGGQGIIAMTSCIHHIAEGGKNPPPPPRHGGSSFRKPLKAYFISKLVYFLPGSFLARLQFASVVSTSGDFMTRRSFILEKNQVFECIFASVVLVTLAFSGTATHGNCDHADELTCQYQYS